MPRTKLDLTLEIAEHTETVEVTADALAAETTSTQLGETLDTKKMQGVPLNGRNFTDLMAVQPGIVPVNTAQAGAVIMTGVASTPPLEMQPRQPLHQRSARVVEWLSRQRQRCRRRREHGTSIVPNLDSIDSFRVLTSNFDAEYGNSSGGQVLW